MATLREVKYDEDGEPQTVTVTLSVREAVLISRMMGMQSTSTLQEAGLGHLVSESSEVYGVMCQFFNRHWENGDKDAAQGKRTNV